MRRIIRCVVLGMAFGGVAPARTPPPDATILHFVAPNATQLPVVAPNATQLPVVAMNATQLPSVTLPPELARVLTDYEKAWRAHDAAALAILFAEDGFVLSNGALPVRGRPEIAKAYANAGGDLVLRAFAFATEGSLGHIVGGFSRKEGQPDVGKFTLTLRREGDGR